MKAIHYATTLKLDMLSLITSLGIQIKEEYFQGIFHNHLTHKEVRKI
jgi:hypothetical protein